MCGLQKSKRRIAELFSFAVRRYFHLTENVTVIGIFFYIFHGFFRNGWQKSVLYMRLSAGYPLHVHICGDNARNAALQKICYHKTVIAFKGHLSGSLKYIAVSPFGKCNIFCVQWE